jgi:hypothetical protein
MPCAITEPGNYPDYIKTILKDIAVGNDDALKACACSLKSPVNDDGCLILDSDGKVGAFQGCADPGSLTIDEFSLNLKDTMSAFWRVKAWKYTINGYVNIVRTEAQFSQFWTYSGSVIVRSDGAGFSNQTPIIKQKELVCVKEDLLEIPDNRVTVNYRGGNGYTQVENVEVFGIFNYYPKRIEQNKFSIFHMYINKAHYGVQFYTNGQGQQMGIQTCRIDGKVVNTSTLHLYDGDIPEMTAALNVNIDAIEYWS